MLRRLSVMLGLLLGMALSAWAQSSPAGVWKTIDDKTGQAKSKVEIYEKNGQYYGKVSEILTDRKNAVCDKCEGKKKGQAIKGLVVIEGLKASGNYWKGGSILDPESGNEYSCSIWFEDGNADELKVRGKHWTGLYRTQTWYRVK